MLIYTDEVLRWDMLIYTDGVLMTILHQIGVMLHLLSVVTLVKCSQNTARFRVY